MKFNRSAIMQTAWKKYRRFDLTFAQALRLAWVEARLAAARFDVWGESFNAHPVLIASGVTQDRAGELEWFYKTSYDRIVVKAA